MVAFLAFLGWCNHDLFSFHYSFPFSRIFTPEESRKDDYILTEMITLKPGEYALSFEGSVEKIGCGWFVVDSSDEILFAGDFTAENFLNANPLSISEGTKSVRVGVRYDPASERMELSNIHIRSNHVLYKESLTRHLVLSLCIFAVFLYLYFRLIQPEFLCRLFHRDIEGIAVAEKVFLFLLILSLAASIPNLLTKRYVIGDDFYFHLYRIEGIASGLRSGEFPARIYLSWVENYGIGCGFYYPDLFFYIPAVLYLLGFSLLEVNDFFIILCAFFTVLVMYLTAKRLSGGKRSAGLIAAVFAAFSTYRLICIYYRSALGEVQAFIFFPLIVWGLYEMFHERPDRWWIFALGYIGLLSSHLISLAIAGVFTVLFLLLNIRKVFGNRKILFGLLKSFLLTMLLCAAFWLPMIEQMNHNSLYINSFMFNESRTIGPDNLEPFRALFLFFDPWHFVNGSYQPYPGLAIIAVPLLRLLLIRKKDFHSSVSEWMLGIGCLALWMSTSAFPWQPFVWFLKRIQVSWRLLTTGTVLLSLCAGIYLEALFSEKKQWTALAVSLIVCAGIAFPIYRQGIEHRSAARKTQILLDQEVNPGEYMPVNFTREDAEANGDTVQTEGKDVRISDRKRQGLSFRFAFESADEENTFSVPLIYHYGYQAEVRTDDERKAIFVERSPYGLVSVHTEQIKSGTIRVWYEKTPLQRISEGITLLTLAAVCGMLLKKKWMTKKR